MHRGQGSGGGGDEWEVMVVQFIANLNLLGKVKKKDISYIHNFKHWQKQFFFLLFGVSTEGKG